MITEFVEAWNKNNGKLEEYIRTHEQAEYAEYVLLVELLFKLVINPEREDDKKYCIDDMLVMDHGGYYGTQIFVLHEQNALLSIADYVYTHTCYWSRSGCDTLVNIYYSSDGSIPSEEQVKDYMTLCLSLLQSCVFMCDGAHDSTEHLVQFKNLKCYDKE